MSSSPTLNALVHPNSISAGPLPNQQSFTYLKQQGIKHLKRLAGNVWSNYNDSDPGVTILDQVAYALTELGYVNSFSIEDVLTQPDGSIRYQEQFFNVEAILTSAPVTIDDYRRFVFDRIECVNNLYITPQRVTIDNESVLTGLYEVAVYSCELMQDDTQTASSSSNKKPEKNAEIAVTTSNKLVGVEEDTANNCDDAESDEEHKLTISERRLLLATEVQQLLNSQRNVGEFFLKPTVLTEQSIELTGEAVLAADADITQVYKDIDQALANYISPLVQQSGYNQATLRGMSADQIFNGPELVNGWIVNSNGFGEKRSVVTLVDVITTLSTVAGIVALENIAFTHNSLNANGDANTITICPSKVASLALASCFSLNKSQAQHNKTTWQQTESELNQLKAQLSASSIEAKVDIAPALPKGRFRHIENYYSIQYTFPDIYGVGPNSLQSDTPDYRVAQARQLKGYLLLFDQVIANQLSQLANLNNLFAFSFGRIASNESEYHASVRLQTQNSSTPDVAAANIPMQPLARTYFYQPLYNVPDVQSLLTGQNSYQYFYADDPSDSTQRAQLVWKRFKSDPFNHYFYGLNQAIENTENAERRRDQMLGHLLARHGESADIYNDMIDAMQWYGGVYKTRIMVKTLWMQNLQKLSYRRNQAINFGECAPLKPIGRYYLSESDYQQLLIERGTDVLPFLQAVRGKGFSHYNDVVRSLAKSRIAQLQQHLAQSGKTGKVNTAKVLQRSQAVAKALPLQDSNQQLLAEQGAGTFKPSGNPLKMDGRFNAQTLDDDAKLSADDWQSHATFSLKTNLLLGLTQHYSALALALVRLLMAEGFNSWLKANAGKANTCRFPDNTTATESTLEELHDTNAQFIHVPHKGDAKQRYLSVNVQDTEVLRLPTDDLNSTRLQQYVDQLLWLAKNQGSLMVEHTVLQASIIDDDDKSDNTSHNSDDNNKTDNSETDNNKTDNSETDNSETDNSETESINPTKDTWYCLQASMIFPEYVVRTQHSQFGYFLQALQQLHWPAHVQLHLVQADCSKLKTAIDAYKDWYEHMRFFSGNYRQLHTQENRDGAANQNNNATNPSSSKANQSNSTLPSCDAAYRVNTEELSEAQITLKKAVSSLTVLTPLQVKPTKKSVNPHSQSTQQSAADLDANEENAHGVQ